jgi:hypothetical protein
MATKKRGSKTAKRAGARRVAAKRNARTTAKKAAPRKSVAAKVVAKKSARNAAKKKTPANRPVAATRAAKRTPARRPRVATKTAAGRPKVETRPRAQREASSVDRVKNARRTSGPAPVDLSLFPVGDEALRAATGKAWSEWLALLDAAGAATQAFDHQRIWELAMQSLPDAAAWWGQMVSVGYERVRGLREKHESCNGEFQGSVSRTFAVPLFAAFAAWADEALRGRWLDAAGLEFTKLNAGKNIRARWPDGSRLDIRFNATGPDKCQVVVDTMKLADADAVRRAKAFWQAQFERLNALLAG